VNVIAWNRQVQHLLLSGSDDGSVKIWDLRNFKSGEWLLLSYFSTAHASRLVSRLCVVCHVPSLFFFFSVTDDATPSKLCLDL
jgi:WD40 repeat protein